MKRNTQGFTLVELMIVIAIIGILAAALFPLMTGYMARSRDTARISDLSQISLAITTYFVDKGVYPNTLASAPNCTNVVGMSNILPNIPKDPIGTTTPPCSGGVTASGNYAYATGTNASGTGGAFVVAAIMELDGNVNFTGQIVQGFNSATFLRYVGARKVGGGTGFYILAR